jgi:FkbM family methyltransferase
LAFDPDSREIPRDLKGVYRDVIMVPRAVTDSDEAEQAEFVLTKYPFCSSTLEPDMEALGAYLFRDYFEPVSRVSVPATSLNRVLEEYGLAGIDWLKLDSQGTDLRIIRALQTATLQRLAAIDVEPGLVDAYQGEDLYHAVDAYLRSQGYWLSDLQFQAYPRVTPESLEEIEELAQRMRLSRVTEHIKRSPTAAEARYLRQPGTCEEDRTQVLLFVFALLDQQVGFAWDLRKHYARLHADDEIVAAMDAAFGDALRSTAQASAPMHLSGSDRNCLLAVLRRTFPARIRDRVPAGVRRWIVRMLGQAS